MIFMYDLFSDFFDTFNNFDVFPTFADIKTCPKCGRSYQDFRKTGKLGCAECYETFYSPIATTIKQVHGTTTHTGKIPSHCADELKRKRRYETLKKELSKAVAAEDYEKAAKLHKELKSLGDM